jgi:hypothetical protein
MVSRDPLSFNYIQGPVVQNSICHQLGVSAILACLQFQTKVQNYAKTVQMQVLNN